MDLMPLYYILKHGKNGKFSVIYIYISAQQISLQSSFVQNNSKFKKYAWRKDWNNLVHQNVKIILIFSEGQTIVIFIMFFSLFSYLTSMNLSGLVIAVFKIMKYIMYKKEYMCIRCKD